MEQKGGNDLPTIARILFVGIISTFFLVVLEGAKRAPSPPLLYMQSKRMALGQRTVAPLYAAKGTTKADNVITIPICSLANLPISLVIPPPYVTISYRTL